MKPFAIEDLSDLAGALVMLAENIEHMLKEIGSFLKSELLDWS